MIGVIGSNGFLGSEICKILSGVDDVIPINRNTYEQYRGQTFDIIINANGNSKKFWANKNPIGDFELSTLSVYKSIFDFEFSKYIYISSVDSLGYQPYGFNKMLSEIIVNHYVSNNLILRCPAIIGKNMVKGVVYDILNNNPVRLTPDSCLNFISNSEIANIIIYMIKNEVIGTFDVGATDSISVENIGKLIGKDIRYDESLENQNYNVNINKLKEIYKTQSSEYYIKEILNV